MVQKNIPLKGRTIAVTRSREQAEETANAIEALGGKPYLFPTIEITSARDLSATKNFLDALANRKADYVILMSVNGVQHLLTAAETLGKADELKKGLKDAVVIAVGPKTALEMEKNGMRVDVIPERFTSDGILRCLEQRHAKGKTIYIPRTSAAPPELAEKLRERGNRVEEVYVYQSRLPKDRVLAERFAKDLENREIDAIIFTSSLGARNFLEILTQILHAKKLKDLIQNGTVVVAIGPTTAKTLTEVDLKVDVMPEKHTLDHALEALVNYWKVS